MKPISVVVVDDHGIVRQGLRVILKADSRFTVVGEAATRGDALRIVAEQQPDVVLLDIKLSDANGIGLIQPLLECSPRTSVLILTAYLDRTLVDSCLRAGARGYLLKDAENLHLHENIMAVVQGHAAFDPRAASLLTDYVRRHEPLPETLRPRDLDILQLMAQGLHNSEIGERLLLSENTIKGYVKEILAKLGAHSRVEAVLMAKERGLV